MSSHNSTTDSRCSLPRFDFEPPDNESVPRPMSTTETRASESSSDTLHHNETLEPPLIQRQTSHIYHGQTAELALTPQVSRTSRPEVTRVATNASTWSSDPAFEVDWEEDDPENPRNWPLWYKSIVIFSISFGTLVVVLYSTSYTTGITQMQHEFDISSEVIPTLGVTTYLLGLSTGSLFLAPISETYGRKSVYGIAMFFFIIFIIPCATASSMAEIIIVRFFGACAGSAMLANAPGTVSDIIGDEYRALAFSIWSLGPMNGPVLGPIIGGFVTQYKGWRWTNWVVLMAAGVAFGLLCILQETYAPALLQQRAKKLRKAEGIDRYWSRYDQRLSFVELMKVNLSRPFSMAVREPICMFWNVYIAILYAILYLCFVAYPIVFTETRGWTIGLSGLAFVGIGIGTMSVIALEPLIRRLINAHPNEPGYDSPPPEAMMSVVCIAAILVPLGELWFAWTCVPKTIHWALPIAAGIPFGAGNTAVFIYASNYIVHSYGIYSASAMAGNTVVRSSLGGALPLAGPSLYRALGANWAGTFLGALEVIIIPIPFIFYRYGAKIRMKSSLIREMREEEERAERKKVRGRERLAQDREREAHDSEMHTEKEHMAEAQLADVEGSQKQLGARIGREMEKKDFEV